MPTVQPDNIASTYLRLRPDSSIERLPFDASFWPRLMKGELGNFHHEYLVTTNTYNKDWPSWERHPLGEEIVCLLSGAVTMILERPGGNEAVSMSRMGDFVCIPRGTWHTAKTRVATTMLFITACEGTENRPA